MFMPFSEYGRKSTKSYCSCTQVKVSIILQDVAVDIFHQCNCWRYCQNYHQDWEADYHSPFLLENFRSKTALQQGNKAVKKLFVKKKKKIKNIS